jgi:hypothetical protein
MGHLEEFVLFIVMILLVFFYKKHQKRIMNKEINRYVNNLEIPIIQDELQTVIPDTCPHCKNPNTKKIRLCEWCGNQII